MCTFSERKTRAVKEKSHSDIWLDRPWSNPQNSKYPPEARREPSSVPVAGSKPTTPRKVSHAAWFSAGSELTRSRIICQATMLSAPSGGGPIAKETEHCGQKQIRCAADFCRGLTPTVCANIYTATDLCPASISRLQRRQCRFPTGFFLAASSREEKILSPESWCK